MLDTFFLSSGTSFEKTSLIGTVVGNRLRGIMKNINNFFTFNEKILIKSKKSIYFIILSIIIFSFNFLIFISSYYLSNIFIPKYPFNFMFFFQQQYFILPLLLIIFYLTSYLSVINIFVINGSKKLNLKNNCSITPYCHGY